MSTTASQQRSLFVAPLPKDRIKINKILIANRGEIACRIIKTCRLLGIASVAVYAEEDASSLHVSQADEAINIGSVATESVTPYLNSTLLVNTAASVGADAIHPGYGYLSENADFADEVRNAGIIFIGPHRKALATLGDKRQAKDYLRDNAPDVPLIPGFAGSSQDITDLTKAADEIGYPVMVKASAGGGGKGLRVANNASELKDALARAQSEAQRSFGSSDCILEKFVAAGKHVEMQIVGDAHGQVACFWERECSVQRRNQKIIEESPCPWITPAVREKMKAACVQIAQLLNYQGAGTVEFIVDVKTSEFYFLEVNARLQVEHPITEEVTGFDLVALQIFVAADGSLRSLSPLADIRQNGHAIECRLCAEDPSKDFIPTQGTVNIWSPPQGSSDVRFETALCSGQEISIYFDSMIAKIVVWAQDRTQAISKMIYIMKNLACVGVRTNQEFLQTCLSHPGFRDPAYTTSFIPDNISQLKRVLVYGDEAKTLRAAQLLPSLFLDQLKEMAGARRPRFKNIRLGFRNQSNDPGNIRSRIVTITDGSSLAERPPIVVLRPYTLPDATAEEHLYVNNLSDISSADKDRKQDAAPDRQLGIAGYNALTNAIRTNEILNWPSHNISRLTVNRMDTVTTSSRTEFPHYSFEAGIDGSKLYSQMAILPSSQTGASDDTQIIQAHLPVLGTWLTFRVQSLLAYFRQEAVELAGPLASADGTLAIKAPMPCKVISVLKKDGDQVKKGETVMVIESMKMETNIQASSDGTFEASVKPGDAVKEGNILCKVT